MQAQTPGGYVDFQRFGALRESARTDQAKALDQVAEEFEAMFVDLMLAAAREAGFGEGLFDSSEMQTYREMLDQQLAVAVARDNDLGIGKVMAAQYSALLGADADLDQALSDAHADAADPLTLPRVPNAAERAAALAHTPALAAALGPVARNDAGHPATDVAVRKNAFVAELAPYASDAAARLGVSPRALVAQAALESGWGRHVIRDVDGASSHNYFGIKAGPGWQGAVVRVPTTEYINGRAVTVNAAFRAYPDPGAAFADYVDFIGSNPRYQDVVAYGQNPRRFAAELAAAGYATDPDYANKIMAIVDANDWSGLMGTHPQVSY